MRTSFGASTAAVTRIHERYELRGELARGGMGIVYRAFDRLASRDVAYKRLLIGQESERARVADLFQREYNTLARLAHPAIVEVYEYGFDDQGPYYTMELLSGQSLVDLAPLPAREACRIIRDVASALALLHARRLIHRDLSPANVRLNGEGRTKLLDFGALSRFGPVREVVGTPAFMAPECLTRSPLDQRADLYALGGLCYWALTRRTALNARNLRELAEAWLEPIVPPSSLVADIPKPLEDLVLSLLQQDPLARPSSAAEVMERLTAIADLPAEPEERQVSYSYIANPPLVGRQRQSAQIEEALQAVLDGHGSSLLVQAVPGAGRSALLEEVALQAQLRGASVLRADAAADVGSFGVARALVRTATALYPDLLGTGQRDSQFMQVLDPRRNPRSAAAWSPVNASERQARTLALMQEVLIRASARGPTTIIVDELQRADSESLALIAALAEQAREHPLLLVLAASKGAQTTDAHEKIQASSLPLSLESLSAEHVRELVLAIFGGVANSHRLALWLYEHGGGNPARCMDLTRLLLQRGLIRYTAGTFTLPHDVSADVETQDSAAALLARVADLGAMARRCACLLGLQEMPLKVEQLVAAAGGEPRDVVLGLEELTSRALVNVMDGRATLLNRALGEALLATLAVEERRELHRRAAQALLAAANDEGGARLQAGMHLLQAGDESEAVELLTERARGDWLGGETPIPLLEAVLGALRRQGRSDEHCLTALVPLVRGGFFGDMHAQRRHLDATLRALSTTCGVSSVAKLSPRLGAKGGLIGGMLWALGRHAATPKRMRFGSFKETFAALLSILSATTAACVSAFDAQQAFRIVQLFQPLRAFGEDSAPFLCLEFCLATAELGAGQYSAARRRYQQLLERFERPVKGMDDEIHLQFRQGILHGLAQSLTFYADPLALTLAEELERAHMFFAPHAETIRMGYHGYRGDQALFDAHRKRGEMLALRGGISWSSVTLMTARSAYVAMQTRDAVTLVRVTGELERLADVAPNTLLYRDAVRAYLELLRGRPERAAAGYEKLFASPVASYMMGHTLDRVHYAQVLCELGRYAEAKQLCLEMLAKAAPDETNYVTRGPVQQLALAEAALGDLGAAAQRLERLIEELTPSGNPLWIGAAHRDRAKVALAAQDRAAFERHARAMAEHFRVTKNPSLIQQCEQLQALAKGRSGASLGVGVVDQAAVAFETEQARMLSSVETFETEILAEPSSGGSRV